MIHTPHGGKCISLGSYGVLDLYLGYQDPLPPTLVARYGNGDADYLTCNPELCGYDNVARHGGHFVEALTRATAAGLLPEK